MFLKSLTLKGFKSFAETTTLEFEPGVTVVVGPNGSGKSNVVDAIGWVLGAQAPSAVRSQKMDDVIFAGTAQRPPLGRAEAALTIDNSAGLLAIDFTEVTISRTLFRRGDSEYAINGVPCRLLDVQDLLSDTGVGRQQHTIVSQGQIDAVLNTKPEERRLIVEEAAGILKYRKRKEKAERRLAATEANLTRLQDLLREVRRQLRPLERQADAARRHGDLVAELRELRTHLAGRELAGLRSRLEKQTGQQRDLSSAEGAHKRALTELDTAVLAAEAELAAMGGDDLGDALVRFDSLRERARGLAAVLCERRRAIAREREAFVDQAVIATLEAEAHRLRTELAEADAGTAALAVDGARVATAEAELAASRARFGELTADERRAAESGVAEVRGELAALTAAVERGDAELARVDERLTVIGERQARLTGEAERCHADLVSIDERTGPVADDHAEADGRRVEAEALLRSAEDELREAEADRHRWRARAEALAQALDAARAAAGAERLAAVDGVLGTLLDLVEVDTGYETAFEAAAGEALTAVVVESVEAGRRALEALRVHDVAGAVLPLLAAPSPLPFLPSRGEPLRRHVQSGRADVERVLDALIGSTVVVEGGWSTAVDVALAHPGSIVVTRKGDRFGVTGWRIGASATGATGHALD
ncbi:MAG: chromosome segregation SMC family protein, partial [Acidimicrobiales bacterium]